MKHADAVESTPRDGSLQLSWLARLIVAHTPEEMAEWVALCLREFMRLGVTPSMRLVSIGACVRRRTISSRWTS